jgi:hypothetical protein
MKKVFKHNQFTAVFSDEGTGPNNWKRPKLSRL